MNATAMAAAFERAGYSEPEKQLIQAGIEAWTKWPQRDAGGARRDYLANKMRGTLAWAAIEGWQPNMIPQMIGFWLNRATEEIEEQRPRRVVPRGTGGGQGRADTHEGVAPASNPGDSRGGGEAVAELRPRFLVPSAAQSTKHDKTIAAKLAVAATLSRLDTVFVNGQKIGDCTPDDVRDWLRKRHVDNRFAEMLIANLPPNRPIRDFIRPDDADELYARAETIDAA